MPTTEESSVPHPDPFTTTVEVTDNDLSPPRGNPFPVVGVGASAGGLEAFGQLLSALPPDTGMAFVLVQHLDPAHHSHLAELLAPMTSMHVETAQDDMRIEPNVVYVIPPNVSMVLQGAHLRLVPREPGLHLPIDIFFRSLAAVQGGRAIGVVLSGNASDGSIGLRAIKGECGLTFVQQETTARFASMPRNAILTGAVDYILSPHNIGLELAQLGQNPYMIARVPGESRTETLPEGEAEMQRLFAALKTATRVDFSHYKSTTIRRRVGRRMMVLRMDNLALYARYAESDSNELRELYRDLLISVTSFFRDPAVFELLKEALLQHLLKTSEPNKPIRVWVPGCATGEEVYSIAICLHELLSDSKIQRQVQFFGTDISESALERARHGIYAETIAQDVSIERLAQYFHRIDGKYQIAKFIRENCIFARHDVTRDPPFSNLDLISCRNLLIYLDLPLQRRVVPMFHYALNKQGLLMLGTAESVASAEDLFTPLDKQIQLYHRKDVPVRLPFPMSMSAPPTGVSARESRSPQSNTGVELQKKVDRLIHHKYSPDAVLVDAGLHIHQVRGHISPYLDAGQNGSASNLLRVAQQSLVLPLRKLMDAVIERNVSVRESATILEPEGAERELWLEATPLGSIPASERYFLIVFQQRGPSVVGGTSATYSSSAEEHIARLETELAEARESLRNLTEDFDAHGEELQAVNEEARSTNEELQSTNEELSTTKEELQSANEELTTVNDELQSRNRELSATNSDLRNLLNAVSLAVLMVDQELRVRRFNPAAEKLLNLSQLDVGRPVGNLRGRIETSWLEEQVRTVIDSLETVAQEAQDKDGRWFSITIRPYRTIDNRIAGAVIAMQDIDALKSGLEAAEEARNYAEGMIETVREPLVVLDADMRVQRATTAFYEIFLVSREETEGRLLYDLGSGQWNNARLRELLGAAMFRHEPFHDFELEYDFPHIGRRVMRLNARRIPRLGSKHQMLLLAIEDTTERREKAETRFQRLFETAKDGIVVVDRETETIVDVNPFLLQLTGYGREEVAGKRLADAAPFSALGGVINSVPNLAKEDLIRFDDVDLICKTGGRASVEIIANGYWVGSQHVVQLNIRDIAGRKAAARELRLSQERFRSFVDSVKDYALFELDRNGVIVNWTSGAERLLGWPESEALGKNAEIVFIPEDVEAGSHRLEMENARREGRSEDERWHVRKDGSRFFSSGVLTQVCDEHGTLRGFAKVMRDVTERRAAEQRLKQQAALLDLAHDAILVRNLDGTILSWNRGAENLYGWTATEALGENSHQLLQTQFPEPLDSVNARLLKAERWDGVVSHVQKDGSQMVIASRWALQRTNGSEPPRVLEINADITARVEQEQRLQRSVEEKSTLVREIHHRVKNNLQVIVSLLSLQSNQMKDPRLQEAFEDTEARVRAIAQIHERLYASEDLTEVEFAGYLTHLSRELVTLYSTVPNSVKLRLSMEEMVLHIEQAIPLGLIANELIINSLKHGLRGKPGTLDICLKYMPEKVNLQPGQTLDEGWAEFCIKDSGPGISEDLDLSQSKSLGYRLITLLVRQVRGELDVKKGPGASIRVQFPLILRDFQVEA